MLLRLIGWLRNRLFGIRYEYFEVADGKYLKIRRGHAELVDDESIPPDMREQGSEFDGASRHASEASLGNEMAAEARLNVLRSKSPYEVAKRAVNNQLIRTQVRQNPELVGADSRFETDLKLKIADGEDIQPIIDANPQITDSDVANMLEVDFLAKLGYTQYGNQLATVINEGEASLVTGDGGQSSDVDSSYAIETPSPTGQTSDGGTGQGADGMTSSSPGGADAANGELSGVASGSINTSTGQLDISTGSSTSGGQSTGNSGSGTSSIGGDVGGGNVGGGDI